MKRRIIPVTAAIPPAKIPNIFSIERPCEINWLDPEPERNSSDYKAYIREVRDMNNEFYKGYYVPPTEEEYNRLIEEASTDEDSLRR